MSDYSIAYEGPNERWRQIIDWCDKTTPGWIFALDRIPNNNGRTVRESLECPRKADIDWDAHATITFAQGDHLMLFKLTWVGV